MTPVRIMAVGVGGAGGRIVTRVADALEGSVIAAAVNTDSRALEEAHAAVKVRIGGTRTGGLGTGGDDNLGRVAAEDELGMIRAMLADARLAVVVAGLGGGTGTGAAPVILAAAREAGATTLCFATLPFQFEGPQRRARADRALTALREACDALIVVPNDRLFAMPDGAGLADAFARADEVLGNGILGLCRMITQPGCMSLDFADLQQVIRKGGGACALGYGDGRGERKAGDAVAALLASPLLDEGRALDSARCVLVSVIGGPDLTLNEISDAMKAITAKLPAACQVTVGTVVDAAWRGRVTVMAIVSARLAAEENVTPPDADPAEPPPGEVAGRGGKRATPAQTQTRLKLDASGRGRFKGLEPTIEDGEDLDLPTFIRRGIPIER